MLSCSFSILLVVDARGRAREAHEVPAVHRVRGALAPVRGGPGLAELEAAEVRRRQHVHHVRLPRAAAATGDDAREDPPSSSAVTRAERRAAVRARSGRVGAHHVMVTIWNLD